MKIEFESREEIQRICALLEEIFPAEICITVDDLEDTINDETDRELPWNWDGYHPPLEIKVSEEAEKVDNKVDKTADKAADKKTFSSECGCRCCSYVSGQLDAIFRCMLERRITIRDAVDVTGRSAAEINRLYRMWLHQTEKAKE